MARIETVDEFARGAGFAQAVAFSAACVERASAILLWVVSGVERVDDHEFYVSALDDLWMFERFTPEQFEARREQLTGIQELVHGDDVSGASAFAYQGAVALYSALGVFAGGREKAVLDCSSTLRNFAFRLGRRCGVDLLTAEDEAQRQDIAFLNALLDKQNPQLVELREKSAEIGRKRLVLAIERFG